VGVLVLTLLACNLEDPLVTDTHDKSELPPVVIQGEPDIATPDTTPPTFVPGDGGDGCIANCD